MKALLLIAQLAVSPLGGAYIDYCGDDSRCFTATVSVQEQAESICYRHRTRVTYPTSPITYEFEKGWEECSMVEENGWKIMKNRLNKMEKEQLDIVHKAATQDMKEEK